MKLDFFKFQEEEDWGEDEKTDDDEEPAEDLEDSYWFC